MSIGSDWHPEHRAQLLRLLARIDPPWFSDHVCYTGVPGTNTHDLLPVPYTRAVLDRMVDRAREAMDVTGRLFLVENPSSYLSYKASGMPEWDFVAELAERADCGLLLDVNNIFVSSINHGFDPIDYLDGLPMDRVVQMHLAGHSIMDGFRLDTHDAPVCDEVWALYREAIRRAGSVTTLVEWDGDIPPFERLSAEAERARAVRDEGLAQRAEERCA
jgi:uncharacterized protein (UPF0276 family)